MPPGNSVTWRTPDVYQQIAAAGKTVVAANVLKVYANQNWDAITGYVGGIQPAPLPPPAN